MQKIDCVFTLFLPLRRTQLGFFVFWIFQWDCETFVICRLARDLRFGPQGILDVTVGQLDSWKGAGGDGNGSGWFRID